MSGKQTATVSIVISAKNRPDSLRRALSSVRVQTLVPYELIVVDDGSDPPLAEMGSDVQLLRNEKSRGMCSARNRGIAEATGEYVVVIDDDAEFVSSDALATAAKLFESKPLLAALGFCQLRPDGSMHYVQPADSRVLAETNRFYGYGFMVRRDVFVSAGCFADFYGYYGEEIEVCLRLLGRGQTIAFSPEIRLLHYEDPRGRDVQRIARLGFRNSVLTVLTVYPALGIPFGLLKAVTNSLRSSRKLVGVDLKGKAHALAEVWQLFPKVIQRREAVDWGTLFRFRSLGQRPTPIVTAGRPLSAVGGSS